ncbi:hypothetical protein [Robiginitalea aurantiaca]|uniref:Uncharacterized protein n=1 Tax=Robiginitalea aurantiaca TaxID=3056915 RepID=A0ABT7WE53_9FLAO|nr:hypothetical protein [Robiginitalea aurantiaca]MDM9631089.1 hypothetical protein [Robiginitalea aurantiaca]
MAGTALLFSGCQEGDNPIDEINANETRGAILRTVTILSSELPIGDAEGFFSVEQEIQSQEDGKNIEFVEVYVAFRDNTGDTDSKDEVLHETIDPSTFTIGEFGYPRFTNTITLAEMSSTLGLTGDQVQGGDQFVIRYELVLDDGRRYSIGDNTNTLTGSFFSSPFQYTADIVCPPIGPAPGVYTVNMQDSFGDGWQTTTGDGGPGLTLTLSTGEVFEVGLCSPYETPSYACIDNDTEGTATITVPAGVESAEWFFPGDFYGEISFQIIHPSGAVIADIGTGTEAGPVLINYCFDY